ncbi:MAG TPA: DsbA family protein [Longimicrobiales bacterium]|nr:DsbA family protein [Longimicrobiales bacterium]
MIELFYDYADPASYLVELHLRAVATRAELSVAPRPFEVRPPGTPLARTPADDADSAWTELRVRAREIDERLEPPRLLPRTRKAHELALHARETGAFWAVHQGIYRALWREGRDVGRVDVLVEIAASAGLDRSGTKAVLDVDKYASLVVAERRRGERLGVERVPTLLAGGRALEGFHPAEEILNFLRRAVPDPS